MKVKQFKSIIDKLGMVISKNTSIPICEGILFADNQLTGTDLTNYLIVDFPHNAKGVVNYFEVKNIIGTLAPTDEITFENENSEHRIEILINGVTEFILVVEPADEFPKIPLLEQRYTLGTISLDTIQEMGNLLPFAGKDALRPAMCGINLESNQIAASNGSLLVYKTLNDHFTFPDSAYEPGKTEKRENVIFFAKTIQILNKLKFQGVVFAACQRELGPYMEGERTCFPAKKGMNIYFMNEEITLITREIDERYMDYKNVIPSKKIPHFEIIVNGPEFLNTVKRALAVANVCTHQVVMDFEQTEESSTIKLASSDLDLGREFEKAIHAVILRHQETATEKIEDFSRIGFNGRLMISLLDKLNQRHLSLRVSAGNKAIIIDETALLMPVMLHEYV